MYIKELTNQLLSLNNNQRTKINIHFIVSEPLASFCFNVNKEMEKNQRGFINMGTESIVIPHITLCMGFVDNYDMLSMIFAIVGDYAKTLTPFKIDGTNLCFKSFNKRSSQYLFINLLQNEFLMEQKYKLDSLLKDKIYPIGWNMRDEASHITVGCYKNISTKAFDIIDKYRILPSCKISQIGISIAGEKGVCLGLLKVFDL